MDDFDVKIKMNISNDTNEISNNSILRHSVKIKYN